MFRLILPMVVLSGPNDLIFTPFYLQLIVRILSFLVSCFCCRHRDENLEEYEG